MIKKVKKIGFLFTLLALTITLTGCNSSFESFNLERITRTESDFENPYLFIVAPNEEKDKVTIYYNDSGDNVGGTKEVKQKLEDITISDTDIVIETSEETFNFERISESVAANENDIQYDFSSSDDN